MAHHEELPCGCVLNPHMVEKRGRFCKRDHSERVAALNLWWKRHHGISD